jgi:hypothetical protein
MSTPKVGDRIIRLKPKLYWEGVIQSTEEFNGETLYHVRFLDPGLDDENLYREDFLLERDEIVKGVVREIKDLAGEFYQEMLATDSNEARDKAEDLMSAAEDIIRVMGVEE